jgi:hypothetical protein
MECINIAAERQTEVARLRKPKGGFLFVRAYDLLGVYAAFRANILRWRDVRVWFAAKEVVARRQRLPRGQTPSYRLEELHGLVGGVGGEHLKASLRRLEAAGLLRFTEHAITFDLDERSVKGARKHLMSIAWLTPVKSEHWHRQRYGGRAVVNPYWSRPVTVGEGGSETKPPPRIAEFSTELSPPESDNELSSRYKNQKPTLAADRPAGVCNEGEEPKKRPSMVHVVREDLSDTGRTLELFEDAAKRGLVNASEADRLRFVAAADRAISVGTSNPPGLFVRIVRAKLWHHLTNDDEDAATRRLKRHFYGEPRPKREDVGLTRVLPARRELSADAKLVIAVKRVASQHRIACDPFHLLRREAQYADWTRERWERAEAELESGRLQVLGSRRVDG